MELYLRPSIMSSYVVVNSLPDELLMTLDSKQKLLYTAQVSKTLS